jgi:hypothetical protein
MDTKTKLATLRTATEQMRSGDDLLALLLGLIDTMSEIEAKQSAEAEAATEAEEQKITDYFTKNLVDDPDDDGRWRTNINNLVFPKSDD